MKDCNLHSILDLASSMVYLVFSSITLGASQIARRPTTNPGDYCTLVLEVICKHS